MVDSAIEIREADPEDLDRIESLLDSNNLPSDDVRTAPARFFIAESDRDFVGGGGVEIHGSDGLLRSVVVDESARGDGLGSTLCDALEERASEVGVDTLYLLTTTAEGFFRRLGYEAIDRETAPQGIRGTTEFRDLCSSAATCMRKEL